jgi:hypothetical protein
MQLKAQAIGMQFFWCQDKSPQGYFTASCPAVVGHVTAD